MKKVLFGIATILFGFYLTYISISSEWIYISMIGLGLAVIGFLISLFSAFNID